jgi:hypothetical protein
MTGIVDHMPLTGLNPVGLTLEQRNSDDRHSAKILVI